MFSKYLDYYQPATQAHQAAQRQCFQKDSVIGHLRGQVGELKQLEGDYSRLNELIRALEGKYSMLIGERDRAEKQQKTKSQIDRRSILDLRGSIDELRVQLQRANLVIQDLLRQNTGLRKQCEGRSSQIQSLRFQIKQIQNKNQRQNDDNRALAISLKGLKQQRKRLEDVCEQLSTQLDAAVIKLKGIQKEVRGVESNNVRLEKILMQAERDNGRLAEELEEKENQKKKGQQQLKVVGNAIKETGLTLKAGQQQTAKLQAELDKYASILDQQEGKGRQFQSKISAIQTSIRAAQAQLDLVIAQQQKQRKQHFQALDRNKFLNGQIDKILALISQCQNVNRQLVEEIQLFAEQDKQCRSQLDRGEVMQNIVEGALRKAALTEEPIRHLKC